MNYDSFWRSLTHLYDRGEAGAVVRLLLEAAFGLSSTDVYCGAVERLSAADAERLAAMMERLKKGEPVQYVIGSATFCDRTFTVAPGVLIPRPETEELCRWIADECHALHASDILDIGTGSGCIAITLALDIEGARVVAWDVSDDAISMAKGNAESLIPHNDVPARKDVPQTVEILKQDALCPPDDSCRWDVIVSNPPYICHRESTAMERNVLDHEPHTALFVPDDDPLLFYTAIARYAAKALKPHGSLYFEINALYARETTDMLAAMGFTDICLRNDQFGKPRFVKAVRLT